MLTLSFFFFFFHSFSLSPRSPQSCPFIATFITWEQNGEFFEISAGYLVANELGGLQIMQEHLPSVSGDT